MPYPDEDVYSGVYIAMTYNQQELIRYNDIYYRTQQL